MIIQDSNNSKISFDLMHLEGAVVAAVVLDNLFDDDGLHRAFSAMEKAFPNLYVRYLIIPRDHGADNHQVDPKDVVSGVQWIKIHPLGYFVGSRRLEPLMGEHGQLEVGHRNQQIVISSIEKCRREFDGL